MKSRHALKPASWVKVAILFWMTLFDLIFFSFFCKATIKYNHNFTFNNVWSTSSFLMLRTFHRLPRNSPRTVLSSTYRAWSATARLTMPTTTTSRHIWTAWAPRTCLCWQRMDLLCRSPAPSTTCQCLKGFCLTARNRCWLKSRRLRFKRLTKEWFCKGNLKRNLFSPGVKVLMHIVGQGPVSRRASVWWDPVNLGYFLFTDLALRSCLQGLGSSSTTSCLTSVGEKSTSFLVTRSVFHIMHYILAN